MAFQSTVQDVESPLAFVREYVSSQNEYLQQAALLYGATTDIITLATARSASGPTAYLAAFMNALETLTASGNKVDQHKLGGVAFLISKILPKVSPAVVQHLLEKIANLFINTLKQYADITFVAQVLLSCIAISLRLLPNKFVETSQSCRRMIQALFIFAVDPRPKIRKPAQIATQRVFQTLSSNTTTYTIPKVLEQALIQFAEIELEVTEQSKKDCTTALHLCGLLQKILSTLSTPGVAKVIAPLLQLTAQGNPFLLLQTFNTLSALYTKGFEFSTCLLVLQQAHQLKSPTPSFLKEFEQNITITVAEQNKHIEKDAEFTYQLLLSVLDLKPNVNDINANRSYNAVLVSMYRMLSNLHPIKAVTKLFAVLTSLHETILQTDKKEISQSALAAIKHIVVSILNAARFDADLENKDSKFEANMKTPPTARGVLSFVRQLFMLPELDSHTLLTVLDIIGAIIRNAKENHFSYFSELLVIIETYHSKTHGDDTIQTACEDVIGDAIAAFTPEQIATILPLNLPTKQAIASGSTVVSQLSNSRIWLLQLYPTNVRNSTLTFFMSYLLPAANTCYELFIEARKTKRPQEASLLHDIVSFIWASFPAFCLLPKDVQTQFKPLMKELVIYYNSEQFGSIAQQPICQGLRNMCSKNLAIVNDRWGLQDDLGLQRYSLDDDDLVLLHTKDQLKTYLQHLENKGKTEDELDESDEEETADSDEEGDDEGEDELALNARTTTLARRKAKQSLISKSAINVTPISKQQAIDNCAVIGGLSKNILPLLFNTLISLFAENTHLSDQQSVFVPLVLDTILAYSCTANEKTRETLFTTAFQQYLTLTQQITKIYNDIDADQDQANEDGDENPSLDSMKDIPSIADAEQPIRKCRALSDILVSMSPVLNATCIDLLLNSVILNFNSPSDILQKKAYAVVQQLITIRQEFFTNHWKNVLIAISTSSTNVQPSALKARLLLSRSVYSHLTAPLDHKEVLSTLPSLLSEVILATKEPNNKLRTAAFELTIAIGINIYNSGLTSASVSATGSENKPQNKQNTAGQQLLTQYLTMVLAGLAANTPRMLSATISVVARLVYEFKSVLQMSIINEIFQTVLILLPSKSREILRTILEFIKISLVTLPPETSRAHVREMLFAISDWRAQERSHFKRKVRIIYQLLFKKFGLEFMRESTPPDDLRLVEYLRKQQLRSENQKASKTRTKTGSTDPSSLDDVFGKDKKGKKGEEEDDDFVDVQRYHAGLSFDEIINMDDGETTSGFSAADMLERSVNVGSKSKKLGANDFVTLEDSTDFLDSNIAAKLRTRVKQGGDASVDGSVSGTKRKSTVKTTAEGKLDFTSMEKDIQDEEYMEKFLNRVPTPKELKEQRKKQRLLVQQHKEEKQDMFVEKQKRTLGSEFTSERGAGDAKRRGMKYDPYAYVPLDPRTLNTKKMSLRQQSKHFAAIFDNNTSKKVSAGKVGPGQNLKRSQRNALKKSGGQSKFKKTAMVDQ